MSRSVHPDPLRPLVWDAVAARLMDNLTGGTFLAALALHVGASNLQIAWLAAIPFLAQVLQLPAVALMLRIRDRRTFVAVTAGLARLLWLVIGVLAATSALGADGLVVLVAASLAVAVVATAAWNWWMRDLVPSDAMADLFGRRLRGATWVTMATLLVASILMDAAEASGRKDLGLGVLFMTGGAAGVLGIWALLRTPHVDAPPSPPAASTIRSVRQAARETDARLVAGLAAASVAVGFALPFAAVYLLRGLGFSLLEATVMACISQLAYLAGVRGWVHVARRHGDRSVAMASLAVLALALAAWGVTGWRSQASLLTAVAALHFLSGYALSGIELATTNLMLQTAPAANAPAHLAWLSVLRAGAAGIGVLASGVLWERLGPGVLWASSGGGWELRGFQVLCMLAAVAAVLALVLLSAWRTSSGVPLVDVVRTMRREVRQMSSVAGMRAFIHAVSYSVELMAAPFAARESVVRRVRGVRGTWPRGGGTWSQGNGRPRKGAAQEGEADPRDPRP